jgi:hypothetical protein
MEDERMVVRQNLKKEAMRVNRGFCRTNLRAQEAVREVYMDEKLKIHSDIILLRTQRNINWLIKTVNQF